MVEFLFFALFIGALITFILSRHAPGLPYTVTAFAAGAALSFIFTPIDDEDSLKQSEHLWNLFQPELLLYVFLPAVLFGEAMSLNFHHVRDAVVPAAVLAGPGALFGALLMAVVAKYLLPYNWDWPLCLLFGSILCATDPVGMIKHDNVSV
jgi:NhaP-type Na+/H+ or K+/H+ antiporter